MLELRDCFRHDETPVGRARPSFHALRHFLLPSKGERGSAADQRRSRSVVGGSRELATYYITLATARLC
jgi:hypothetical protein